MIVYPTKPRAAVGGLLFMTLAAAGGIHAAEAGGAAPVAETVADPAAAQPLTREQIQAAMAVAQAQRETHLKPDPAAPNAALAERWGVEVIGLSRTAGGYMLDFRFRVVDAEKALPLFDHRIKPYVVAEKSGINLPVPVGNKVGALRPTNRGRNITADRIYYMVFANPDTYLEYGDKVSVVIGDFRVDHLTVH